MRKLRNEELQRLSPQEYKNAAKNPITIVLENVRSLHNVGSVFRTADAFRVQQIFLCGITATPPHREIHKTALGATETVDWKYFQTTEEAIQLLRNESWKIFTIEQAEGSVPLFQFSATDNKLALIFGNEVDGVDQKIIQLADGCIEIPQGGTKHSLNIAVSVGVVVWEICRGKFEV